MSEKARQLAAMKKTLNDDDPWSFQNEFFNTHFKHYDFSNLGSCKPLQIQSCNCCEIYYECKKCTGKKNFR